MDICGCKECENPVFALGMCQKHWKRNRLYGSPFALMSKSGLMRGMPLEERFKRQCKVGEGCWEWTGAIDADGYGRISGVLHGVSHKKAHRVSWVLANGKSIPPGMHVCHSCDNPKCVNPAHLWLGTNAENMHDKFAKGRHITDRMRGEARPEAKLTEQQVRTILSDARPYSEIGAEYGVHRQTVSSIKNRESWAHVDVDHIARPPKASNRKGKGPKITEAIVREIKASAEPGKALAERYGVSPQLITNIRKRRVWKHVE